MSKQASRNLILSMVSVALLAIGAPAAHADTIYNLTLDGCSGGCGPQSLFGTINLHQVASVDVLITVSLVSGNRFVTTGVHSGFAFNVQGRAVTVGTLPTGWVAAVGTVVQPGFGLFSNGVDCAMGNTNPLSACNGNNPWDGALEFHVTRDSGLLLTDFVGNLGVGSGGTPIFFSADIISGTNGNTGAVAALGNAAVPEPGTLVLLVSGILGLAGIVRRRSACS